MKRKKTTILMALIVIIMTATMCLTGCNKDTTPSTVELSTDNYADYLAINVVFDTPEVVPVYATTGTQIGNKLFSKGTVKVAKNNNCHFVNCSFSIVVLCEGWPHDDVGMGKTTIQLSYDGVGEATFTVYDYESGEYKLTVPTVKQITVTSLQGTVVLN